MTPGTVAQFHFDDRGGRRLYVVVSSGRRWTVLMEAATLRRIRIDRPSAERALVRKMTIRPGTFRCALRRRYREARRLGLPVPVKTYRTALAAIEREGS